MLTEDKIKKLKHEGKSRVHDEHGLYLQTNENGAQSWLLRYEIGGRERYMGLGKVADFKLREARDRARRARQLLADGVDPIEKRLADRDAERAKAAERITFKEATEQFLEVHAAGWRNPKHQQQFGKTLKDYIYPQLGARPINALTPAVINEALGPIWQRIPNTASRIKQRVERVTTWVRAGRPLPTKSAKRTVRNHPAMKYQDLPAFMTELGTRESISARALQFCILCAARSNEVLRASWSEIDLQARVWMIPPSRMKSGKVHRVPLSSAAIELLQGLPTEQGNDFLFIGQTAGGHLSAVAMFQMLRSLRQTETVHGFRATFKTWASERTNFPREVVEQALAHTVGTAVERAYARGDLFQKRIKLMGAWAAFCSTPAESTTGRTVVALRKA